MSINIDNVRILKSNGLRIPEASLTKFEMAYEDEFPEDNFIDSGEWDPAEGDMMLTPAHLRWCGEGSGTAYDLLKNTILPAFEGEVDLLLTWEDGEALSGLKLRDGVVTEHEVDVVLV